MDSKKRRANRIDKSVLKEKVTISSGRELNPLNADGFDVGSLGSNPFLNNLEIVVNKLMVKGQYRRDGDVLVGNEVDFDKQQSTRIFISPVNRKIAMGLNYSELRLFVWLSYEVNQNKDYLWINVKRFLEESEMSINSYKSAFDKLCRYCYIYPIVGLKDVVWVNPAIFFNGNRVKCFPSNVKVYEPKKDI
jgi:hypothetical protein